MISTLVAFYLGALLVSAVNLYVNVELGIVPMKWLQAFGVICWPVALIVCFWNLPKLKGTMGIRRAARRRLRLPLVRLGDSRTEITAALERMRNKPEAERPFVVVEHAASSVFVQFAGSVGEEIKVDCPPLKVELQTFAETGAADYAAEKGLELLRPQGLTDEAQLRIVEDGCGPHLPC